jgi:hypothetical protein
VWYDPTAINYADKPAITTLHALHPCMARRPPWLGRVGHAIVKRGFTKVFGQHRKMMFEDDPDKADAR